MPCALLQIAPVGLALAAPFAGPTGDLAELPAGALVQADGVCADGSARVTLRSVPRWLVPSVAAPPVGTQGCVDADALRPAEGPFLVQVDAPPLVAGQVALLGGACGRWAVDGRILLDDALAALRPVTWDTLRDAARVQDAYQARFGPLNLADVPLGLDGFVGLPLPVELDAVALAEEHLREHLDTPERQQRAVRWYGGPVDGRPSYAHFLGADLPYSDVWAAPDTVIRLLDLAHGWARACPALAPDPAACLLQLGDLAWYADVVPDPLGHKDHHAGSCVDVRLFRTDGSRYESWYNQPDDRPQAKGGYSQELTLAFLRWVSEHTSAMTLLYNDPAAREVVPGVQPLSGHDDHIHLCF